jgi:hypothetical protein
LREASPRPLGSRRDLAIAVIPAQGGKRNGTGPNSTALVCVPASASASSGASCKFSSASSERLGSAPAIVDREHRLRLCVANDRERIAARRELPGDQVAANPRLSHRRERAAVLDREVATTTPEPDDVSPRSGARFSGGYADVQRKASQITRSGLGRVTRLLKGLRKGFTKRLDLAASTGEQSSRRRCRAAPLE